MIAARFKLTLAVGLCCLGVSACGDDGSNPEGAPGTAANPLTAATPGDTTSPGATVPQGEPSSGADAEAAPGYKSLVEGQESKPQRRFTPCNLVTGRQAQQILGEPVQQPVEALQGPTCIYRPRAGDELIALAVQSTSFAKVRRHIEDLRRVDVSDRDAYCGTYGQPMLYLPLARGRLLSIGAECDVARRFALTALPHL